MQQAASPRKHVLVIDDERHIRDAVAQMLEDEGYEVATAPNGDVALQYLRSAGVQPALILLDLMMPIMNGMQFRTQQQQDPRLTHIPVVVMSAGSAGQQSPHLDVSAFLPKPFYYDQLLGTVAGVIG